MAQDQRGQGTVTTNTPISQKDIVSSYLGKRFFLKQNDRNTPKILQVVATSERNGIHRLVLKDIFKGDVAHFSLGEVQGILNIVAKNDWNKYPKSYLAQLSYNHVSSYIGDEAVPVSLDDLRDTKIKSIKSYKHDMTVSDRELGCLEILTSEGKTLFVDVSRENPEEIERFLLKAEPPRIECLKTGEDRYTFHVISARDYYERVPSNRVEIPVGVSLHRLFSGDTHHTPENSKQDTNPHYAVMIEGKRQIVTAQTKTIQEDGSLQFLCEGNICVLPPEVWLKAEYVPEKDRVVKETSALETLNSLLDTLFSRDIPSDQVPSVVTWGNGDTLYIKTDLSTTSIGFNTKTREVIVGGEVVWDVEFNMEKAGERSLIVSRWYENGMESREYLPITSLRCFKANPTPEDILFHPKTGGILYKMGDGQYHPCGGSNPHTEGQAWALGYLPVDFAKTIWPLLFNDALNFMWQFTDTHFVMSSEFGEIHLPLMYLEWYKWLYHGYFCTGKSLEDTKSCIFEDKRTGHKMLTSTFAIVNGKHAAYDLYTEEFLWVDLSVDPGRYVYLPEGETYTLELDFVPEEYRYMAGMTLTATGPALKAPSQKPGLDQPQIAYKKIEKSQDLLTSAGYKLLATQISKACGVPLAAWASKASSPEDAHKIEVFMKTKAGQSLVTSLVALALSASDKKGIQPLAREFRVLAMTQAGDSLLDAILEPFLKEVKKSLAGHVEGKREPVASLPEPSVLSIQVDTTSIPETVVTTIH